jgi:hypothetical protein
MQCDLKAQPRHFKFEASLEAMFNTKGKVKNLSNWVTKHKKRRNLLSISISRSVILLGMKGNKPNGPR